MAGRVRVPSVAGMSFPTQAPTYINKRAVRFQGGGLRYLDASGAQVLTRPRRDLDDGQHWRVTSLSAGVSVIQHVGSGGFLAAGTDHLVVTRSRRISDAQLWRIEDFGGGFATIQQVDNGHFLEAAIDGDF